MNNANNLIRYTKFATVVFIVLAVLADALGFIIVPYIVRVWADKTDAFSMVALSVVYYLGSVGAFVVLISFYRLLGNMGKDIVFDVKNTKLMKIIAVTCFLMGADCVVGTIAWFGTIYVGVICFFMAMVILCVRTVFEKAIEMKNDLDLTI